MAKKPAMKKPVVNVEKSVEVKTPAQTAASVVKKEEVKAAEVKPIEEKTEATKAAAEPKVENKLVAKAKTTSKTAAKTTKATKEKVVVQPEVFVQYTDNGEQEANVIELVNKVKALYVADGHRESSIKSLQIYMKPQEWKVYYVINNKITGSIDMF